jgi:hypothetical protein
LEYTGNEYLFQKQSPILAFGAAVTAMVLLLMFTASGSHAFIYFQF